MPRAIWSGAISFGLAITAAPAEHDEEPADLLKASVRAKRPPARRKTAKTSKR